MRVVNSSHLHSQMYEVQHWGGGDIWKQGPVRYIPERYQSFPIDKKFKIVSPSQDWNVPLLECSTVRLYFRAILCKVEPVSLGISHLHIFHVERVVLSKETQRANGASCPRHSSLLVLVKPERYLLSYSSLLVALKTLYSIPLGSWPLMNQWSSVIC